MTSLKAAVKQSNIVCEPFQICSSSNIILKKFKDISEKCLMSPVLRSGQTTKVASRNDLWLVMLVKQCFVTWQMFDKHCLIVCQGLLPVNNPRALVQRLALCRCFHAIKCPWWHVICVPCYGPKPSSCFLMRGEIVFPKNARFSQLSRLRQQQKSHIQALGHIPFVWFQKACI